MEVEVLPLAEESTTIAVGDHHATPCNLPSSGGKAWVATGMGEQLLLCHHEWLEMEVGWSSWQQPEGVKQRRMWWLEE